MNRVNFYTLTNHQRTLFGAALLVIMMFSSSAISNPTGTADPPTITNGLKTQSNTDSHRPLTITENGRTAAVVNRASLAAVEVSAIRNLGIDNWLPSLEIEVKNITSRPVSCIVVVLHFPDVKRIGPDGDQRPLAIVLRNGRTDLLRSGNLATVGDVPIRPGDTYVFTIPEISRRKLEDDLAKGVTPRSAVQKFFIMVDSVIFEDGTGFKSGLPIQPSKQALLTEPGRDPTLPNRDLNEIIVRPSLLRTSKVLSVNQLISRRSWDQTPES